MIWLALDVRGECRRDKVSAAHVVDEEFTHGYVELLHP